MPLGLRPLRHNYIIMPQSAKPWRHNGSWSCVSNHSSIHLYGCSCIMELGAQTKNNLFLFSQCKTRFIHTSVCIVSRVHVDLERVLNLMYCCINGVLVHVYAKSSKPRLACRDSPMTWSPGLGAFNALWAPVKVKVLFAYIYLA